MALNEYLSESIPQKARTKEEIAKRDFTHGFTSRYRNATTPAEKDAVAQEIGAAFAAGKLSLGERKKIYRDAAESSLGAKWKNAHLKIEVALDLFELASDKEKAEILPLIRARLTDKAFWATEQKNRTPDDMTILREKVDLYAKTVKKMPPPPAPRKGPGIGAYMK